MFQYKTQFKWQQNRTHITVLQNWLHSANTHPCTRVHGVFLQVILKDWLKIQKMESDCGRHHAKCFSWGVTRAPAWQGPHWWPESQFRDDQHLAQLWPEPQLSGDQSPSLTVTSLVTRAPVQGWPEPQLDSDLTGDQSPSPGVTRAQNHLTSLSWKQWD